MNECKQINITGTTNRYKIKKLTTGIDHNKKRVDVDKWNISKEIYKREEQLILLQEIEAEGKKNNMHFLVISQIEKKLAGYKQQDISKKLYDSENIIKINEAVHKLVESELKCFYCKNDMHILYELVREMQQWTLDRIDNEKGHLSDNVEISCLDCNLKRKKQNSEKFLFTKQMKIIRNDF